MAPATRPTVQHYLIALGSNRRHHRHGLPQQVIAAALARIGDLGTLVSVSRIIASEPVGPSERRYANAAAVLHSDLDPLALLAALKELEAQFGRRHGGQRWRARVLDLDIVLWSDGCYAAPGLVVPHPRFRERDFVLAPAARIAPGWRDPVSGLTLRQLAARLTRHRPLPRERAWSGP